MGRVLIAEGFPGQRLLVLPRPLVQRALRRNPTSRLLVTDAGHFPHAASHGRIRSHGAPEAVVIICIEGRGWCTLAGRTFAVPAGTALIIPPHLPHGYRADDDQPWTIWWLHAAGRDVPSLLEPILPDRVVPIGDLYRATATVTHVVDCLSRDETEPNLIMAAGLAWSLLAQLAADKLSGCHGQAEPVRAAQDHLREHFADPVRVGDLARLAGLSPSHFAALFRRATGSGVIEYVKRLRMARARELLATTTAGVREIAGEVGYDDPFYFSRQFRAVHGCSPTTYRTSFT
ncbi:helix-turn-helix domain-containing protein [Microlunatus sp. GCM10028923]|uniref:AraC family transcriptional regulator n=1 Tax=Microlunatus sp. GCM10028923 TaxID=3273400 RepID=UPI00361FE871